jgi:hypothetical protein
VVTGGTRGITGPVGRLVDVPTDRLLRVFEVDVVGYLLCARRAALDMAPRGGAIVNCPRSRPPSAAPVSPTRLPPPSAACWSAVHAVFEHVEGLVALAEDTSGDAARAASLLRVLVN